MPRIVMLLSNPYRPDPRVRREALALQEGGYDILLFAWDREIGHPRLETSEGIEIRRIGLSSPYDDLLQSVVKLPLLWLRMLAWLLREEFEVIHSHDLDTLPVGLLAARVKGKPCVFDAHEIYSAMVSESVPRWILGLLRWVETILVAKPDLLITGSERFGGIYSEMGARNVVVVMNSPPRAEIEGGNRESVRQSLGVEGKGVCLYAGMFERSRNLETIIRAFKTMEDEDPILVLGGTGSLAESIKEKASNSRNIMFVGWIDAKKKTSYVAAADIVLILDDPDYLINRLAISTRLMEAMALGVPVLVSEGTASADLVEAESVGLRVKHDSIEEIQDAIRRLLSDDDLRDSLVRNCIRVSEEKYSWEVMMERLREAYRQLPLVGIS